MIDKLLIGVYGAKGTFVVTLVIELVSKEQE